MHILEEEMSAGLNPATHAKAAVKMFPTYVRNTPRGTEIGQVLALDLGGTNFRVLLIDLRGNARVELTSKIFVIPQSIMIGDGKLVGTVFVLIHFHILSFQLFRHLAECLFDFMQKENLLHTGLTYPLGQVTRKTQTKDAKPFSRL